MNAPRCLALAGLVYACAAAAHDARPNTVRIVETTSLTYSVSWKLPASLPADSLPSTMLPKDCEAMGSPAWRATGGAYVGGQSFRCRESLAGRSVGISYPTANPGLRTIFKVELATGEEHLRILGPAENEWIVPTSATPFAVAVQYTHLGIVHIWIGVDHLLFVACLLFIARTPRRLLLTITGFTAAHSITLALAALDLLRIPTPPVEAVIALSVVFLAWEIARGDADSLTHRLPVVVSVAFGLLHGFGFATVLREVGLPQTELPIALLFFNVGVEIGQVLFVLGVLAGGGLARISHQAACRRQKALGFHEVDRDVDDRADCGLRWPRPPALRAGDPRGSFGPVRARAPSTVVPAMLSVASARSKERVRTGPKSSAIITAPGEKCGLVGAALGRRPWRDGSWLAMPRLAVPASYVIGAVASYWMIERVAGFWG